MKTYLVIKDNVVVNAIVWDGVSEWDPPSGTTIEVAPSGVSIGWTRIDGEWIAPEAPPTLTEDPYKTSAIAKLSALGLTQEEIEALIK